MVFFEAAKIVQWDELGEGNQKATPGKEQLLFSV
jgi:hypothetical protein